MRIQILDLYGVHIPLDERDLKEWKGIVSREIQSRKEKLEGLVREQNPLHSARNFKKSPRIRTGIPIGEKTEYSPGISSPLTANKINEKVVSMGVSEYSSTQGRAYPPESTRQDKRQIPEQVAQKPSRLEEKIRDQKQIRLKKEEKTKSEPGLNDLLLWYEQCDSEEFKLKLQENAFSLIEEEGNRQMPGIYIVSKQDKGKRLGYVLPNKKEDKQRYGLQDFFNCQHTEANKSCPQRSTYKWVEMPSTVLVQDNIIKFVIEKGKISCESEIKTRGQRLKQLEKIAETDISVPFNWGCIKGLGEDKLGKIISFHSFYDQQKPEEFEKQVRELNLIPEIVEGNLYLIHEENSKIGYLVTVKDKENIRQIATNMREYFKYSGDYYNRVEKPAEVLFEKGTELKIKYIIEKGRIE